MAAVRRLLAILLFTAFALPLALPLLGLGGDAEAGLPACCRRHGAHHCGMTRGEWSGVFAEDSRLPHWQAPAERCPYCPGSVIPAHVDPYLAPAAQRIFAELLKHPSVVAQTESKWRVARDRSRGKRGPPLVSLA